MPRAYGFAKTKAKTPGGESARMTTRQAFNVFDKDGSGSLSVDELRAVLSRPGGGAALTDEEISAIIAEFDANGDGEIQYEEFVTMWEPKKSSAAAPKEAAGSKARQPPPSRPSSAARNSSAARPSSSASASSSAASSKTDPMQQDKPAEPPAVQAFKAFDEGGKGALGLPELRKVLARAEDGSDSLTAAQLGQLIARFDAAPADGLLQLGELEALLAVWGDESTEVRCWHSDRANPLSLPSHVVSRPIAIAGTRIESSQPTEFALPCG